MVWVDNGFERVGSFLAGRSPSPPTHLSFSYFGSDITGSETSAGSEFVRKSVTWSFNDLDQPNFVALLSTVDANGSYIDSISLWDDSVIGSGEMFTLDVSAIGSKNNTFDVQVEGVVRFFRP